MRARKLYNYAIFRTDTFIQRNSTVTDGQTKKHTQHTQTSDHLTPPYLFLRYGTLKNNTFSKQVCNSHSIVVLIYVLIS